MEVKKIIVVCLFCLIGKISVAQDNIVIGSTHFTAPNSMLYEWRNLQKEYDFVINDNKLLEQDRNTCLNNNKQIQLDNSKYVKILERRIKIRNNIIKIVTTVAFVETIIGYFIIKS